MPTRFITIQTSAFSGATLLALLLARHPQIATVGEMDGLIAREDPATYRCSCGQRIMECRFWADVSAAMHERGHDFNIVRFNLAFVPQGPYLLRRLRAGSLRHAQLNSLLQLWPGERRRLEQLVARNEAFIESVLAVTGKQVFVDTSKDRLRLDALRRCSRLELRAIHLVRDVRGVVASRMRREDGIPASEAARQWARLHRRLQSSLAVLPEAQRIRVRYEDLCQDLPGTLERLYRFCGVDPRLAPDADDHQPEQHIVGNAMRLAPLAQIRLDERWRTQLSGDQLSSIQRIAGELSRQYGYQLAES